MSWGYNHLIECGIQNINVPFHMLGGVVSRGGKAVFILLIKHWSSYCGYIRGYLKLSIFK